MAATIQRQAEVRTLSWEQIARGLADYLEHHPACECIPRGDPVSDCDCGLQAFVDAYRAAAHAKESQTSPTIAIDIGAVAALRDHQKQIDEDGTLVGVSRQALDHVLSRLPTASQWKNGRFPTAEDFPAGSVRLLCTCGAIVAPADADAHCATHTGAAP